MKRRHITITLAILSLLFILSIACKQSGKIITPAEATQRYEATQAAASGEVSGDAENAKILAGDKAILTGTGYLVAMYSNPGDTVIHTYATRGDEIIVEGSLEYEGEIWYKIESLGGRGWLPEENLQEIE